MILNTVFKYIYNLKNNVMYYWYMWLSQDGFVTMNCRSVTGSWAVPCGTAYCTVTIISNCKIKCSFPRRPDLPTLVNAINLKESIKLQYIHLFMQTSVCMLLFRVLCLGIEISIWGYITISGMVWKPYDRHSWPNLRQYQPGTGLVSSA